MKTLRWLTLALCVACLSSTLALGTEDLPTGRYLGSGEWGALDGSSGTYTTSLTITPEQLTITSSWEQEGETRDITYSVTLIPRGAGFFDLADEKGAVIGELACHGQHCTYWLEQEGARVRESLVLGGSKLTKFGSKAIGEYRITWTEKLIAE